MAPENKSQQVFPKKKIIFLTKNKKKKLIFVEMTDTNRENKELIWFSCGNFIHSYANPSLVFDSEGGKN